MLDPVLELGRLAQALVAERREEETAMASLLEQKSLRFRRADGLTWSPVTVNGQEFTFGGRPAVQLEMGHGGGRPGAFRSGTPVSLYQANEAGQPAHGADSVRKGIVRKGSDSSVEVVLDGEPLTADEQHARWTLDLRPDDRTFKLMGEALSHWINTEDADRSALRDAILKGQSSQLSGAGEPAGFEDLLEGLNESQQSFLKHSWSSPQLSLLHGPPGTGKTTTLIALIRGFARQGQRILATAPSNAATDLLALRLREAGLDVVRIGHPIRIDEAILSATVESQVAQLPDYKQVKTLRKRARDAWREADRFRRNFGPEERRLRNEARREARDLEREATELEAFLAEKVLREAPVICATLAGSADRMLARIRFDIAVIDEAGQALEPATWIPMQRADRFVLAGDPRQLPPVVKSSEARALGLEISLLEKLLDRHADSPISHFLDTQYRMNTAIQAHSNAWFYEDKLKAHASVADTQLPDLPPWTFIDTAGKGFDEQREAGTDSTCNPDEAAFVMARLEEIVEVHPEATIGVVAPYSAQVRVLQDLWHPPSEADQERVDIATVDGFQGQERDMMVLSLTRSNDSSSIGFLSEYRRTNVAMTRARKHLLLVGDGATLGADPFFAALLDRAEAEGRYKSAWEY